MNHRPFPTASLLLALLTLAGASSAAPNPAADPKRPTLVSGATQSIAGAVKAGAEGAEWVLPGGSTLTASPGAELRVLGVPQPVVLGTKKVPGYTVLLRSGHVKARVPDSGKSAVVLSAPRQTSVLVTSGETSVVAGPLVAVANAQGASSVGSGGQSFRPLQPGTLEVVEGGGSVRRALVAAPTELRGAFVLVSYGDEATFGEVGWSGASDASGYRVELRDASTARVVLRTTAGEARLPAGFARLSPGKYLLSVASIDRTGLESKPTEQPVRVIGLTLPAGGYVDDAGAVRFPAGTSLPLSNAEGVEMTYGGATLFVSAPHALELLRPEPRLVRFRIAGNPAESQLWLVPRDTRARIAFGPKAPHWPGSPLEIRIRVEDSRGKLAPSFIEARPRVSVGVERADVEFSRQGEWLRGVLPAQRGKGPWVVRVEVEDQSGIALGRDFVEVAGAGDGRSATLRP